MERREPPKVTIVFYIILYMILSAFTVISARSDKIIMIGDSTLPVATFAGVFSSLSNVYLVVMVLYYKILITAFTLLLVQLPVYLTGLFASHNLATLPGMFSGAFTDTLRLAGRLRSQRRKGHKGYALFRVRRDPVRRTDHDRRREKNAVKGRKARGARYKAERRI